MREGDDQLAKFSEAWLGVTLRLVNEGEAKAPWNEYIHDVVIQYWLFLAK